jgi:hypothetical protein
MESGKLWVFGQNALKKMAITYETKLCPNNEYYAIILSTATLTYLIKELSPP